ncbi:hypothetical protein [Streptomyces sp. NPDC094049]|uniref:DUF7739 domain-containing protein n=1 Tax=Streptomyces sp. NPDC094049 TaxID=3154987 RepID=UPI0033335422
MPTHIITSHGADFSGEDWHPAPQIAAMADYARSMLPADVSNPLVDLLAAAPALTAEGLSVPASDVRLLAELLGRVARERFVRPPVAARARLLADAAARAAADREPWTWTTATTTALEG